jgi:hypothetical protein
MTAPTNIPVLYQNVMFGLPSDLARDAFLWATERPGEDRICYRAEKFAREVHDLFAAIAPMLDASAKVHGAEQHDPDLMKFILKRHANWRFGGNLHPIYLDETQ